MPYDRNDTDGDDNTFLYPDLLTLIQVGFNTSYSSRLIKAGFNISYSFKTTKHSFTMSLSKLEYK